MLDKFPFLKDTRLLKETPRCSVSCLPINVLYLTGLQTNLGLSSDVDFPHCPKEIDVRFWGGRLRVSHNFRPFPFFCYFPHCCIRDSAFTGNAWGRAKNIGQQIVSHALYCRWKSSRLHSFRLFLPLSRESKVVTPIVWVLWQHLIIRKLNN